VGPGEVVRFLETLQADCRTDDLVVLSGSLPDSVPASVAGEVVRIGAAAGSRTLVDIHSEALRHAVAQRPWMVKCNRHELAQLLEDDPGSDLPGAMQRLRDSGIEVVVVTLGAEGALIADDAGVARVRVPAVDEVNPTGSGDLLLAGLTVGLQRGLSPRGALVLGAACGTAGATHLRPELPPGFDPDQWTSRIALEPVAGRS
jgi:fructose-1-phosphate kinase PfkB-like protein